MNFKFKEEVVVRGYRKTFLFYADNENGDLILENHEGEYQHFKADEVIPVRIIDRKNKE